MVPARLVTTSTYLFERPFPEHRVQNSEIQSVTAVSCIFVVWAAMQTLVHVYFSMMLLQATVMAHRSDADQASDVHQHDFHSTGQNSTQSCVKGNPPDSCTTDEGCFDEVHTIFTKNKNLLAISYGPPMKGHGKLLGWEYDPVEEIVWSFFIKPGSDARLKVQKDGSNKNIPTSRISCGTCPSCKGCYMNSCCFPPDSGKKFKVNDNVDIEGQGGKLTKVDGGYKLVKNGKKMLWVYMCSASITGSKEVVAVYED